jgi:flagellar motor protein MotB
MTLPTRSLRTVALAAFLPVALVATGCRSTSPCCPPTPLAEAPEPVYAPAPAPYAAPRATVPPPAPVVMAPPRPDPDQVAKLETMRLAIEAKNRQAAELEARLVAERAATETSLRSRADAEAAAQRLADELRGIPGAQVMLEGASVSVIVTDSFESGSDRLRTNPDLRAALKAASQAIARHPDARVSIVGHTDSQPIQRSAKKWSDNEHLSKARAEAVATVLAGEGAPKDRLAVVGKGAAEPVASPERNAADRARNRRVEIEFAFSS